jgi:hypothetical protein
VARIEAVVGPTRRRPAKKRLIAATVETMARQASQPQPATETSSRRNSPSSAEPAVSDAAAPVQTSADSTRGRRRAAGRSLTRMYVL